MHPRRLAVPLLAAATAAALALPAAGAAQPQAGPDHSGVAAAAKVGKWTRLSERNVSSLSEPHALALGSGGVQVIWYSEDTASSESIRARTVKENGRVGSPIVSVVKGWSTLVDDPKIINNGASRMVVFGGIRSTNPGEKFYGPMAYATSSNGTSWTLGGGSLTQTGYAYASYGTAAVDDGGVPLVGVVASSTNFVTLHRGISPQVPAPSGDWTTNQSLTGYTYSASLGRDLRSGDTWAVWVQDFGTTPHSGILAQRVYPTPVGSWQKAPASTASNGDFLAPDQGVAVASRVGGQVWAAYKVGYPTANKIRLWRVGSSNAGFTVRSKDVRRISLLPGPGGRLWLAWYTGTSARLHVARTNPGVTKLGIVRSLKPPTKRGSYSNVWETSGSGRGGPLHLVINAQIGAADPQIWYQKVLPGLTLVASPRSLNKGKVVAKVADAGAPVAGARVRFLGKTKTTRANGTVVFKVKASVAKGKQKMTAKKGGYAQGHAVVKVT